MLLGAALQKEVGVSLHVGVTAGDDSDGKANEEAVMQGEAAGKAAYKRVQASSAAAIQHQKAVRSQVTFHVSAYSVWSAGQAALPCSRHAIAFSWFWQNTTHPCL